ncbi:PTS system beta-glucoside-specific IIBCA component [Buttiauxella brennerae ATCC 51605]|uniref:PTS system beta-glucoside-specific IIBCA component n=1 Tax=Buttiauxella brennerae ATCC 51605 TaxID=1354251 RepID=A0A1B7IHF7_9ENTR|nr:PTS transporter subunit EIIC [Buttiauxella brennerae]OAT28876.1 PTS system beta-glucoside-specific IIBCA component [Buttiauxella brennerae ATCC 51605]
MTTYSQLAQQIIKHVGEPGNIEHITHCATRLRFTLKDKNKVNPEALYGLPEVVKLVDSPSQFQIVIGPKVDQVCSAIKELLGEQTPAAEETTAQGSWISRLLATLSAIFTPYIGVLAGVGVVKGIVVLLQTMNLVDTHSYVFTVFNALSSGVFVMLPLFIAVTASERFKTNKFTALALTAAMIFPLTDPSVPGAFHIMGLALNVKIYGGAVIPAVFAVLFLSYVERWLKKIIPELAAFVFVPCLSLIICGFVVFTLIGPIADYVGVGIANGYAWLYNLSPVISGALLAGIGQLFVVFGVHWGIIPLALINIQVNGYDTIMAMFMSAVMGQFGAAFGAIFIARNLKDKQIAISASISAFFGITEPALYGVNLKYRMLFVFGCIGAALGGGITGLLGVKTYSFLPVLNVFELGLFSGPDSKMIYEVFAIIVAFTVPAVLTIIYGKTRKLVASPAS